jgi:ABC-type transport system substrate-binding protein
MPEARPPAPPRRRFLSLAGRAIALVLVAASLAMPCAEAQPGKAIRVAFPVAETGFDPQAIADSYSSLIASAIFEPLYTYDYFALPAKLVPAAADALPEVSPDLTTYTIRLKKGLRFADDPAFGGKAREVTAQDYVYSWKRLLDPKVRSYFVHVFENRLVGGDAAIAAARKSGAFDYDAPIEGLTALDRYTIRVRFSEPYFGFRHWLTSVTFAAVAREVVDRHKDASNRVSEHPVGSGPYRLVEWRRSQKIVLEANPNWRDVRYPAPTDPADKAIAGSLVGRKLPLVPRVEISIIEEPQPRLLSFERGEIDMVDVPNDLAPNVLHGNALKPSYVQRGIVQHRMLEPALNFTFFNLDDPVVGGYTPERIALRRAMIMGYDRDAEIRILRNGQAIPATQISPPWTEGYDPKRPPLQKYDPAGARAARSLRLQGPRRRRLPRDARRQAALRREGVDAQRDRPHVRRAVEEEHGRDRHPDGVREAEVARPREDGGSRQAADVGPRLDRLDPRPGLGVRAALQQADRHDERRAAATARVRPAL